MSVAVQTRQARRKFSIDPSQFEEIFGPRDERTAIPKNVSTSKMDKGSESERLSNEEGNKTSKKNSKSSDYSDEDSYDDDFEESEVESLRKSIGKSAARSKSPSHKRSHRIPETTRTKSPSVISPRSNKKGKRKKRYKPYESTRSTSPATSRLPPEKNWGKPKNHSANVKVSRIDHTVVDRVLSANRHKVTKLESRLSQLIKELTKEREENRTLRLIQQRQEKKLEKVIGEEAELPQLLVKHTAEVKSLRERLRKVQDVAHQKDEKLHEQDKIILKLRDKCKYYKDLCDKDELTEKSELQKNLSQTQENLKKRDEEISKLQRMLNLKEKTHSRNLKEQKEKLREAQDRLQLMKENCNNLQGKLRVREKQLDYTNIYQRQIVLKEKTQMPLESPPRMAALPAPKRNKPKGKNSPISKIKGTKTKEINKDEEGAAKGSDEESNKKPSSVFLTAQSDKESGSDKDIIKAKSANDDNEFLAIMDGKTGAGKPMVNGGLSDDELKDNERRKREEFEKDLRQEEERLRKEKEEVERRLKDIQEKEEREKAEREAKWREDSARRVREAEERRQASARRQEEEKRKEEERQIEERKRDEERRDDEGKREQEGREQERTAQGKKPLQSEDSFFEDEESRRKKDALLARLKAMDSDKASDEDLLKFEDQPFPIYGDNESAKPKASKSYEARNADKNLHNGLPAFPKGNPIVSPPESVKSDPDGVFGVPRGKPVLIGRGNLTKKNANQFSWLDDSKNSVPNKNRGKPNKDFNFGDYSPSVSDKKVSDGLDADIFNTDLSRRAGRGRRREGGLGGDGLDFGERRGSEGLDNKTQNTSLGILSDDFGSRRGGEQASGLPSSNSPLLPRRRAAQGRNGPAAISSAFDDNLDDDIEEFTL